MSSYTLPPEIHYDLCGYLSMEDIKSLRLCAAYLGKNLRRRLINLRLGRPKYYGCLIVSLRLAMNDAFQGCDFKLPHLQWTPGCDILHRAMDDLAEALVMARPYLLGTHLLHENMGFDVMCGSALKGIQYVTNRVDPKRAVIRVVANPEQTKGIMFDLTCLDHVFGDEDDVGRIAVVGKTLHATGYGVLPAAVRLIDEIVKYTMTQRSELPGFCFFGPMRKIKQFVYNHQLGPLEYGQAFRPGIFNMI